MFARVTTGQGDPARRPERLAYGDATIIPALKRIPGFHGGFMLGSVTAPAESLTIHLWETMEAATGALASLVPGARREYERLGLVFGTSTIYQVFRQVESEATGRPGYARIVPGQRSAATDAAMEAYGVGTFGPALRQVPGFHSMLALRAGDESLAVYFYDTYEHASGAGAAVRALLPTLDADLARLGYTAPAPPTLYEVLRQI